MWADQFAESPAGKWSSQPRRTQRRSAEPTHATILALQRTAGNRAVARWVGQRASPTGWKYYSSFKPRVLYDTEAEAETADREEEATANESERVWSEAQRSFTLYTYTNVNPLNQLSLAAQGPHTVAHVNVADALAGRGTRQELRDALAGQVPDPDEFERLLREERGEGGKTLQMNYERVTGDYRRLYATAKRVLDDPDMGVGYVRELVGSLMDLHPYATYGWKSGQPVSDRARAGKAENRQRFNVDAAGDWRYPERAADFIRMRYRFWKEGRGQHEPGATVYPLIALIALALLMWWFGRI